MDDDDFNLELATIVSQQQPKSKLLTPLRACIRSKDIPPKKLNFESSPNSPVKNR